MQLLKSLAVAHFGNFSLLSFTAALTLQNLLLAVRSSGYSDGYPGRSS